MTEGLGYLASALVGFAAPEPLFNVLWATLLGIAVGMLPGLTATLGVALMTTLTFRMGAADAILILICMYVGAIYGGGRSAILLNIPGTPASAAATLDGFPLARAGRAGQAMGIATSGSVLGTLIGMVFLALLAPVLADFALEFGAFEFFWLALFGVVIAGRLTALGDPLKGWLAGFLGLLLAMVGQEGIHAYERFSFGHADLAGGFGLLPALVGTFGFPTRRCAARSIR
jgi:putative tricarboxylic transport membrane protein